MTAQIMVELHDGYGDGYGVVMADDAGEPTVEPGTHATHYSDHGQAAGRIEEWKRTVLAQPSVILVDGGVKVPTGAIKRVIGPLDCPEAVQVAFERETKNWGYEARKAEAAKRGLRMPKTWVSPGVWSE